MCAHSKRFPIKFRLQSILSNRIIIKDSDYLGLKSWEAKGSRGLFRSEPLEELDLHVHVTCYLMISGLLLLIGSL